MNEIQAEYKSEKNTSIGKVFDLVIPQLSNWKNCKEFRDLRTSSNAFTLREFDELECIFVHILKSAGKPINWELFGNLGGAHRTIRSYKRVFGPLPFSRFFKFTFVRNPYSRFLSAYRFLKNGGYCKKDLIWASQNLAQYNTFSYFVHSCLSEESINKFVHFKPQYMFICDRSFEPDLDYIGRHETNSEDSNTICRVLNTNRELKVHNQGPVKKALWSDFYTEEMYDKVYQVYKKDFDLFGYNARP